jgi:hypothetical protein
MISPALRAQDSADQISCRADNENNQAYKKKLWDGYEISLGPVRNPDETEFKCTAAIYSKAGHVVFRTNGFNVVFDENLTGEDLDGDGKPEVVFRTDTGGGNHCCWGYILISLFPRPHKLAEIAMEGKVDFEKTKDGKGIVWERVGGPMAFTSMASRPFAAKVERFLGGKLVDATPEYCGTKDERLERSQFSADDLKKLADAGTAKGNENDELYGALESRTFQHVLCREFDEAVKDLSLWPPGPREELVKAFQEGLSKEYPEFAEKARKAFPNKEAADR